MFSDYMGVMGKPTSARLEEQIARLPPRFHFAFVFRGVMKMFVFAHGSQVGLWWAVATVRLIYCYKYHGRGVALLSL